MSNKDYQRIVRVLKAQGIKNFKDLLEAYGIKSVDDLHGRLERKQALTHDERNLVAAAKWGKFLGL